MSRQEWLRTRYVAPEPVDSRPMEAAILDVQADTMRDMVNNHLASIQRAAAEDALEPEDFIEDEELDGDLVPQETLHTLEDRLIELEAIAREEIARASEQAPEAPPTPPDGGTEDPPSEEVATVPA